MVHFQILWTTLVIYFQDGFKRRLKEFPSRFLKGDEIAGKEVPVTVKDIKKELVHSRQTNKKDEVLVMYFKDKERGVVMKKERSSDMKSITGSDDTDGWIGKTVIMYTQKRKMKDGIVDVIRFKQAVPASL